MSGRVCHCLCLGLALLCSLLWGCNGPEGPNSVEKLDIARAHLRAERYYSALSLLHNIPPTEQNTPELYLMQALAHFKLEDYLQATAALEQASPTSAALQIFLAYLYLLVGEAGRANAFADTIESLHGPTPDVVLLKGNINLKAHQYQEAERRFHGVLTMAPTSVKALIGLGHAALLQRRLGKAEEYYLRALFLSVNDISPQLALVNFYTATQRYDDAEEALKLSLERYPNDVTLQIWLSHFYIKRHRSREAIVLLERVLALVPFDDSVKAMATRQYFALGRFADAMKLIHDLLSRDAGSYHALILYGEYYFRKHQYELSLNYFQKALTKNANSHRAHYYIGVIHVLSQNMRLATHSLEKSIQTYPDAPHAHLLLAAIALQSRKYSLAYEYANVVLKLAPGNIDAHVVNGIARYIQGHFEIARYEFDVVAMLEPQNSAAMIFRSLIAIEQGHPKELESSLAALASASAERIFLQAQALRAGGFETISLQQMIGQEAGATRDPTAWLILGHFYAARDDVAHAEEAYRQAAEADQTNVLAFYALAQLEAGRANRPQAIAYIEQAIAINPTFTKSYRALGSLYELEKDYRRAREAYERGLQYATDDAVLLNNLAWVHLMPGGDMGTAYMHIRQAVTLDPNDLDVQDTLAWWHYLSDDYRQAVTILKKIVRAQPERAIYHYHLGMAYLKSGDSEQARHHLQQAVELGIDAEHRGLIREHLP